MGTTATKKKTDKEDQRTVTPEFRVSYAHVFKPHQFKPADKPKYSVTMLFPKSTDMSVLKLIIKHAKIDFFGPNKEDWPDGIISPIQDGDIPDKKTGLVKEGYKGHWAIKATTNEDQPPQVVDAKLQKIIDPRVFYSGCYAFAYVYAYGWEYGDKVGVSLILDGVQKSRDGKPFGGKKAANQMFNPLKGSVDDDDDDDDDTSDAPNVTDNDGSDDDIEDFT